MFSRKSAFLSMLILILATSCKSAQSLPTTKIYSHDGTVRLACLSQSESLYYKRCVRLLVSLVSSAKDGEVIAPQLVSIDEKSGRPNVHLNNFRRYFEIAEVPSYVQGTLTDDEREKIKALFKDQ